MSVGTHISLPPVVAELTFALLAAGGGGDGSQLGSPAEKPPAGQNLLKAIEEECPSSDGTVLRGRLGTGRAKSGNRNASKKVARARNAPKRPGDRAAARLSPAINLPISPDRASKERSGLAVPIAERGSPPPEGPVPSQKGKLRGRQLSKRPAAGGKLVKAGWGQILAIYRHASGRSCSRPGGPAARGGPGRVLFGRRPSAPAKRRRGIPAHSRLPCRKTMRNAWWCLLWTAAVIACADALPDPDELHVKTMSGVVGGTVLSGARAFLGIPYAAPAVGAFRWVDPQPVAPWGGVRDASRWGAGCPQSCNQPPHTCPPVQSEDCLTLNVFAPFLNSTGPVGADAGLPVLVFLPGGRFLQGGAGVPFYSGEHLASRAADPSTAQGIVVVTVSYRLGVLGFLATGTSVGDLTGNYGLEDQRAALRWVRDNIASFGGDPARVTLAGESAGATSIAIHLVSPRSQGLFSRAVMESNPWSLPLKTVRESIGYADRLREHVGCGGVRSTQETIACLRNVDPFELVKYQTKCGPVIPYPHTLETVYAFSPVIDSPSNVPGQPLALLEANRGPLDPQISVILGWNHDEGTMFIYEGADFPVPADVSEVFLVDLFGVERTSRILAKYPIPSAERQDTRPWLADLCTNFMFACSGRRAASLFPRIWVYEFLHAISFHGAWGPRYPFCEGKVCHGTELVYVFDTASVGNYSFTQQEDRLVDALEAFWQKFAAGATDPRAGPGVWRDVVWQPFNMTSELVMYLDLQPSLEANVRSSICDFWDAIGYST